jgi:hypothetical protein
MDPVGGASSPLGLKRKRSASRRALEHARDATAAAADPAGGAQSSAAGLDLPRIRPAGWRCCCHGRSRSSSSPGRRSRLRIRPTVASVPLPVPCNVTSRFSRWVQCMVAIELSGDSVFYCGPRYGLSSQALRLLWGAVAVQEFLSINRISVEHAAISHKKTLDG